MKTFFYLIAVFSLAGHISAQEASSSNVMKKLKAQPDLLSAWNALNDSAITSPAEIRQNVMKLMTSGDDEVRLLVMREKRELASNFLAKEPTPTLNDSSFLAQAILATALSNQPTPGGEEQSSQKGTLHMLEQMLRKSLSTEGASAEGVNWEGDTQADVASWLQALTSALLTDKSSSNDQRAAAIKILTYIEEPVSPDGAP